MIKRKIETCQNHAMFCVKSVRIRSYSGPHFSRIFPHSDWIRRDKFSVFSPDAGKMWTRIISNTDTFYATMFSKISIISTIWTNYLQTINALFWRYSLFSNIGLQCPKLTYWIIGKNIRRHKRSWRSSSN